MLSHNKAPLAALHSGMFPQMRKKTVVFRAKIPTVSMPPCGCVSCMEKSLVTSLIISAMYCGRKYSLAQH